MARTSGPIVVSTLPRRDTIKWKAIHRVLTGQFRQRLLWTQNFVILEVEEAVSQTKFMIKMSHSMTPFVCWSQTMRIVEIVECGRRTYRLCVEDPSRPCLPLTRTWEFWRETPPESQQTAEGPKDTPFESSDADDRSMKSSMLFSVLAYLASFVKSFCEGFWWQHLFFLLLCLMSWEVVILMRRLTLEYMRGETILIFLRTSGRFAAGDWMYCLVFLQVAEYSVCEGLYISDARTDICGPNRRESISTPYAQTVCPSRSERFDQGQ